MIFKKFILQQGCDSLRKNREKIMPEQIFGWKRG